MRQPHGRVTQLFPIDGYGYIESADGHEVYFQKRSVLKNAFERLAVGSMVSSMEEAGEKGSQASTVKFARSIARILPFGPCGHAAFAMRSPM